jgi:hypothetical protein
MSEYTSSEENRKERGREWVNEEICKRTEEHSLKGKQQIDQQ